MFDLDPWSLLFRGGGGWGGILHRLEVKFSSPIEFHTIAIEMWVALKVQSLYKRIRVPAGQTKDVNFLKEIFNKFVRKRVITNPLWPFATQHLF